MRALLDDLDMVGFDFFLMADVGLQEEQDMDQNQLRRPYSFKRPRE